MPVSEILDIHSLREMSVEDLRRTEAEYEKTMFFHAMADGQGSSHKPHLKKLLRKAIARVKTILTEKVGPNRNWGKKDFRMDLLQDCKVYCLQGKHGKIDHRLELRLWRTEFMVTTRWETSTTDLSAIIRLGQLVAPPQKRYLLKFDSKFSSQWPCIAKDIDPDYLAIDEELHLVQVDGIRFESHCKDVETDRYRVPRGVASIKLQSSRCDVSFVPREATLFAKFFPLVDAENLVLTLLNHFPIKDASNIDGGKYLLSGWCRDAATVCKRELSAKLEEKGASHAGRGE